MGKSKKYTVKQQQLLKVAVRFTKRENKKKL